MAWKKNYKKPTNEDGSEAPKKTVAEILTDKILENIEKEGKLPWQQGYIRNVVNWSTQRPYNGMNRILLSILSNGGSEFITVKGIKDYNEAKKTRYWFKSGTPNYLVCYKANNKKTVSDEFAEDVKSGKIVLQGRVRLYKDDTTGKWVLERQILKYTTVYDIRTVVNPDGECLPSKLQPRKPLDRNSNFENLIESYFINEGVAVKNDSNSTPYYTQIDDTCHIPPLELYISSQSRYYKDVAHEMIHSTGVDWRMNRDCYRDYHADKKKYARGLEELIAEFGAVLLVSDCGFDVVEHDDITDSANYIASWCKYMKENPKEVVYGTFMAEKAKNYIVTAAKMDLDLGSDDFQFDVAEIYTNDDSEE